MPDHWRETTLGEVAEIKQGETIAVKDLAGGAHPVFGANGIVGWHDRGNLAEDSVALGCRGSCGTVHIAPAGSFLANNVMGVRALHGKTMTGFLAVMLEFADLRRFGVISGQVQEQITRKSLAPLPVLLPPLGEQRRIVDLIGSIDTCIGHLEGQIDATRTAQDGLLSEILSNPGDDWNSVTLGNVATVRSGFTFKSTDFGEVGLPVVKIANVRGGVVDLAGCSFLPDEIASSRPESLLHRGDLLITMTGDVGAVGRVAVESAVLNQRVGKVATHDSDADVGFLFAFLRCAHTRRAIRRLAAGNAQPNVSPKALHSLPMPLPPLSVQHKISDLIDAYDRQIEAIQAQVAAVRSMRTAVLSDLLSGERTLDDSYDLAAGLPVA